MLKADNIIEAIVKQGILPLYFHPNEKLSREILRALFDSGIRVVEYTNRGKQALTNFKILRKLCENEFPGMILGLGTVLDQKTAVRGWDLGAEFLVSPGFNKKVSKYTSEKGILWIPGCMTPTELMNIQSVGVKLVKIFPANMLGSDFLKSVKEVFPEMLFMPTGGVDQKNMESWIKAGASALGIGSSLINKPIVDSLDFESLKMNTRALLLKIAAIRTSLA